MSKGSLVAYDTWAVTDYMPINPDYGISWKWFNDAHEIKNGQIEALSGVNAYFIIDYFDAEKTYISEDNYVYNPIASKINIPSNAAYMIISTRTNLFTDGFLMLVNDSTIPETYKPYISNSSTVQKTVEKTNGVRSISRLGFKNSGTIPEQSLPAYVAAYTLGFRIMLCDLQFTSDNIPVCYHDSTLDSKAKNSNGTAIASTVRISDHTYAELSKYDLGIAYGETYKGLKLLKFEDMVKWAKLSGVELYVEMKYLNFKQAKIAVNIVEKCGMVNCTSWASHFRTTNDQRYQAMWISQLLPTARVALMTDGQGMSGTDGYMGALLRLKNDKNTVFAFNWNSEILTEYEVNWMIENGIEYEQGTIDNKDELVKYFTQGCNSYCTGVESNSIVADKVLLESMLNG